MILELIVSLITLACIIVFVGWLAMQPQKRILQIAVPMCIISFAVIYAFYLVAYLVPDEPIFGIPAAFSAFVETFGSFTNGVAYSDVAESDAVMEAFSVFWFETLFWALHMLVIITLAISGFAVFGRKFMDKVRLHLYRSLREREIYFVFGDSDGAVILGRNIAKDKPRALVVLFSDDYSEDLRERIADFGGALVEVTEETREQYLAMARSRMRENVVEFEGVVHPTVNGDSIADLLARYVVRKYPPYKSMDIPSDENLDYLDRIPTRPYSALIVGFGKLGSACLKQLIMASQFTLNETRPKFYVIDKDGISFDRFCIENPDVWESADIVFRATDIFSFEAQCMVVDAACDKETPLHQVYICCAPVVSSNPQEREVCLELNSEICRYVSDLLVCCGWDESHPADLSYAWLVNPCVEEERIWTPEIVLHKELDKRGIYVSGGYKGGTDSVAERSEIFKKGLKKWNDSGEIEFYRDSSRAAATFMEAYFGLIGIEPHDPSGINEIGAILKTRPDVIEALAEIEHNRWNAFHYCNGYTPMNAEELIERKKAAASGEQIKPNQDFAKKKHICLVPWERLPDVDALMKQDRGTYQEYDRENIHMAYIVLKGNL